MGLFLIITRHKKLRILKLPFNICIELEISEICPAFLSVRSQIFLNISDNKRERMK